jgi:hypothetical protein
VLPWWVVEVYINSSGHGREEGVARLAWKAGRPTDGEVAVVVGRRGAGDIWIYGCWRWIFPSRYRLVGGGAFDWMTMAWLPFSLLLLLLLLCVRRRFRRLLAALPPATLPTAARVARAKARPGIGTDHAWIPRGIGGHTPFACSDRPASSPDDWDLGSSLALRPPLLFFATGLPARA